jgi:hypothetical protein
MPIEILLLTFSSGRIARKLILHLSKSDLIDVSIIQNATDIIVKAQFEPTPSYGNGTLSLYENEGSSLTYNAKVSQLVIDHLTTHVDDQTFTCYFNSFNAALNSVTLDVSIGLTEPELTSELSQLTLCQNCASDSPTKNATLLPRSDSGDIMHALMFHHSYNQLTKDWSKLTTSEIFKLWKAKLTTLKVTSPALSEPWRYIDGGYKTDRYGLCYGLATQHPIEEQEIIKSGKQHNCSILSDCPLNLIFEDEKSIELLPEDFCDYLEELFSNYFLDIYFASERSQLGLSVLSFLWSNHSSTWKRHPSLIIINADDSLPLAPWVQKPTTSSKK